MAAMDYYLSQDFGFSTSIVEMACYYVYKDMDDIEAVEINGIIFKE